MLAHVLVTLLAILLRAESDREVYPEERGRLEGVVRKAQEKIQYAIAHPDQAGSPEDAGLIGKYGAQMLELLSAYVDFCTNTTDYTQESDFFNSSITEIICTKPEWIEYFRKNFGEGWSLEEFYATIGAIVSMPQDSTGASL